MRYTYGRWSRRLRKQEEEKKREKEKERKKDCLQDRNIERSWQKSVALSLWGVIFRGSIFFTTGHDLEGKTVCVRG